MYLPDSNIFIRAFQEHEIESTFLKKIIVQNKLIISVVAIAEFYPKAFDDEIKRFRKLFDSFEILEINKDVAEVAGYYRKEFLRKTKRVFVVDCFLAAQAKVHNLTLVTNNKADFPMKDIKMRAPFSP